MNPEDKANNSCIALRLSYIHICLEILHINAYNYVSNTYLHTYRTAEMQVMNASGINPRVIDS